MPQKTTDPLGEVRAAARRNRHFYTEPAIRRAAALLADMYAAGESYGVTPDRWGWVANLPAAAIDVIKPRQDEIPQTPAAAVEQLDQVVAALRSILADDPERARRVERDVLRVRVPRSDATPWARHDLAISLDRVSGWVFLLYVDGPASVVGATGPFGKDGAAAIAELAIDVVNGLHGNKFQT
jgi:hypothetical protein